jgi:hypothetical protein
MIIGEPNTDFKKNLQKKDPYRRVNHVAVIGPVI